MRFLRAALQKCFHLKVVRHARVYLQKFSTYKVGSEIIQTLDSHGMIKEIHPDDCSEAIQHLTSGRQTVYAGFDPTAESLHIGNLLILMTLLHWQRSGHNVIIVIGSSTASIGDPSGKSKEREQMEDNLIESNCRGIEENISRIFENHEKYFWKKEEPLPPIKILNNKLWYEKENVIDFFGKIGRKLRMGPMMSRKSIRSRLENDGLSYAEFSYQIFQAYDWLYLFDKYNCMFQVGGSDQLANIDLGHDLLKRSRDVSAFGVTVPLVKAESGSKYGKTAGNAVWLNENKTSPFDIYQFFLRLPDTSVETFLKMFTFYTLSEIDSLVHMLNELTYSEEIPNILSRIMLMTQDKDCDLISTETSDNWFAQKKLAESVTLLVHGEKGLKSAKLVTDVMYNESFSSFNEINESEMRLLFKQIPCMELPLEPGITIVDLAMKAKCFRTKDDAERIISSGGLYINNKRVTTPNNVLDDRRHIFSNRLTLLRTGKRNHYFIKWL